VILNILQTDTFDVKAIMWYNMYEDNSSTKAGVSMKGYKNKNELAQKYKEFASMKKVADYYGVSKRTIMNYMDKYGLKRNSMRLDLDVDKMVKLFYKGHDLHYIAGKFDVAYGTVRKRLQERGIETDRYHCGFTTKATGYIYIYMPEHPMANKRGYIPEHTLIMEKAIGRYLKTDEVVHHINGIKNDNALSNLKLMSAYQHKSLHSRKERKTIDVNEAHNMLKQGYTVAEVCEAVGVSRVTLMRKLEKAGLRFKLARGTPAHKENRVKTV
jgi:AraC-like DNA-binding protein